MNKNNIFLLTCLAIPCAWAQTTTSPTLTEVKETLARQHAEQIAKSATHRARMDAIYESCHNRMQNAASIPEIEDIKQDCENKLNAQLKSVLRPPKPKPIPQSTPITPPSPTEPAVANTPPQPEPPAFILLDNENE